MRHQLDGGRICMLSGFDARNAARKVLTLIATLSTLAATHAALQTGILKEEFFQDATRAQVESGTVTAPTAINYPTVLEFGETGANFTRRVSGVFIPPAGGNYVFFVTSDDDSALFLSTDENPANKRMIAQETGWSDALQWTASAGGSSLTQKRSDQFSPAGTTNRPFASGIPLVAGTRYYIEAIHAEGGGGDNLAATFKLVAEPDPEVSTSSAMTGPVIGYNVPATVTIVGQPVSRRLLAGQTNTFSVSFEPAGATVQWFKGATAIPGATDPTYTTEPLTAADNGATFHAVVTGTGGSAQSSNAVVTIGQNVAVPNSLSREVWDGLLRADIIAGPTDPVSRSGVLSTFEAPTNEADNYSQRVAGLFIAPTTGNYVFYIAADDDADLFLSTDATPANKRLIAQETGWSAVRNWRGANGQATGLSAAQGVAQKHSNTFIPGLVDDPTLTGPPPFAAGIALTAGTQYYIESAHHEGGGGDNLVVAYRMVGQEPPLDGEGSNIGRDTLGTWAAAVGMNGARIIINSGPTNTTAVQNRTGTFSISAMSRFIGDDSAASPGLAYQWQTAPSGSTTFTNIPGASSPSVTVTAALADQGRQFRAQLYAGDTNTTSTVATLNVTPDTTAPRPVTVTGVNAARNIVTLSFNEALDPASATTGANYSFAPGTIAGATVILTNGTNVTITTAAPLTAGTENTLTITGVKDLAGNTVAPNTTIKFTFNLVTYAANIIFDGPVGYFRFEETGGTVATNSGTSGINGIYYEGDEASPGAGGTERPAANVPGPRPGAFVGFDANNLAGEFDGVDDWVDARAQYLQNVNAFSLEYWVRPHRTNEAGEVWANRIGIVGQNDAVEYGFINPTTIETWTTPSGAAQVTYTFPDDEWHHVATIADGTSIRNYFDGVLVGTGGTAAPGGYGASPYNVHIGGGGITDAAGNWFRGQIDEVAVFNKAIPAERVAAHYQAGKSGGVITTSGAVTPPETSGGGTTLSVSRTGGTLTISWTPTGGTLQTSATLGTGATWTDVGTQNPATVQTSDAARFYRVRQ